MTTGRRTQRWLLIALLALLSGCGVKGDLYLPDRDAAADRQAAEP
ncbi:MAG: lipoprotein [Spiribacter sp.]|jgi:predicted small lipoprotein YifL|nr:lipoprotein [Spiribacter sp.]MDR9479992.1 lipoprotein [Spiribacter sp.]